ncbi:LPS translocon maturation chaperone LptM [Chitiniphilus eburneus]|uniref:Sugar transporter n=1 Tax=Chitiniphilus eburneus TaxID=2571148 RepID=A0A4U0QI67_9NEIS|nr:lipoprotein [Chitiniphilus eburneus]TJZ75664.1 hypothetical protein FAZ21_07070 [Chitiniphilus eburneus]
MRVLLPLLFVLGFAGCGFKGDLYLPPQTVKSKPRPAAITPIPAAVEGATSAPAIGDPPPVPGTPAASAPAVTTASFVE